MRTRWLPLLAALLAPLSFVSCANNGSAGGPPGGTGPFDANGNYVESWADSPQKWKKGGSGTDASPDQAEIVAIQEPLMKGRSSSAPVTPVQQVPIVRPNNIASSSQPKPRPRPSEDDESDRPKVAKNTGRSSGGSSGTSTTASKSTTTKGKSTTVASNKNSKSSSTKGSTAKNTTTKGKGSTASTKTKPKPTSNRYTVRQGDSLYAIAKRYGTTAGAIQKANGMSGTMIKPGQSLTVPSR